MADITPEINGKGSWNEPKSITNNDSDSESDTETVKPDNDSDSGSDDESSAKQIPAESLIKPFKRLEIASKILKNND